MLSDYTVSRWGRRKPYIAIGATLDVLFLIGVGLSNSYLALVTFLVAVQFSSNFAQGPFRGYVPDLVPQRQVALASALVGIMQTAGFVLGTIVITYGVTTDGYLLPLVFTGIVGWRRASGRSCGSARAALPAIARGGPGRRSPDRRGARTSSPRRASSTSSSRGCCSSPGSTCSSASTSCSWSARS
jgi:MFS family permease